MSNHSATSVLPPSLIERIEASTGARLATIVPRAGGGASRQGAQVELVWEDGRSVSGYLSFDTRTADRRRMSFFQREAAVLRALSGPLSSAGVRVPRFLAADEEHLALLTTLVNGSDKPIADPVEAAQSARDCVAQIAALHQININALALEGFGDPSIPVSERIRIRIAQLREENLSSAPEPVLLLALEWLEANIPEDAGRPVLVHGDAGPGNFLHENGRVTALLDWELTHFGDPMEDLAQIWVRMLFQPFLPMARVFEAYEAAGGRAVDLDRVLFHRLFFQTGFIVSAHSDLFSADGVRSANLGVTLMFYTVHMRVIIESLAELTGTPLQSVSLPDVPVSAADRGFDIALEDIREVIAPRAADQQAQVKAKSLARLVKYWRARDRYGAAFDAAELREINGALGVAAETVGSARRELALAIVGKQIDPEVALKLCHARMTRDTVLMNDGLGAFAKVYFPPAEENG